MSLDTMALYQAWQHLDKGASAQLRRVSEPDELLDIPAFYRLVQPFGWPENRRALLRLVFCLSAGKNALRHLEPDDHHPRGISLGAALVRTGKIHERRVFQLLRADWPNDMIQLRRLVAHAEPSVHWPSVANQLIYWGPKSRCQLLEDFVLAQSPKKTA
jgi:CRISPR system Cascade subunit CasB